MTQFADWITWPTTPCGPYIIGAVSLWCMRAVGERKDGSPIICARRKSRAGDAACKDCTT